jgi:Spy/CpxP family protein refolding chaperone
MGVIDQEENFMSRKKIRLLICALLLGGGTAASFAIPIGAQAFGPEAGPCGPGLPPGGPLLGPLAKELGLSDVQSERLRSLQDDSRDFQAMKMIEKGKLHRKMMDLLDAQVIDKKAIASLQLQINEIEGAMGVERSKTAAEIAEVLTSEQRKNLRKKRLEGPPMGPPGPFMMPPPPFSSAGGPPHRMPPPPAFPPPSPPQNGQDDAKRMEPAA